VSETCKHGVTAPRGCLLCEEDSPTTPEQRLEAARWKFEHYQGFINAVWECADVQTLWALAHRLGYKEGM
jgi:hypothetical protein